MIKRYQDFVRETSRVKEPYWYACLGLAGETGEVIEHIKKVMRDEGGVVSDERKQKLVLEMGDVLWYLTRLASDLDTSLETVIEKNIEKLTDRRKNGKNVG